MHWFRNLHNRVFVFLLLLSAGAWLWERPLNSPWLPYVAGDGLGYYSYLPAVFIHHDAHLEFKWFAKVYNDNYVYDAFENPEDNLLVQYGNRKINKYYPGLSFIWAPFFFAGHLLAKILDFPPDGFSGPYQWTIGVGSVFYLTLGLIFLRKLLQKMFGHPMVAAVVPFLVFFGTHLFFYGITANTLSHAYSFTFIVLFLYFVQCYFNDTGQRTRNFLWVTLFFVITLSIRPFNGLILLATPAFIPPGFFKAKKFFDGFTWKEIVIAGIILFTLIWHFSIVYIQTHSFFAYTYTNETFDFTEPKFVDALISYRYGLFIYVPLAFLALAGIFFLPRKQQLILPVLFFAILFVYSCWWFWPITKRAMIDWYAIPAILLAAFFSRVKQKQVKVTFATLSVLCIGHYQLKQFQVNNGILNEFATYKELFWRNYFRIDKANIYPIPPYTILESTATNYDFENTDDKSHSTDHALTGTRALKIDSVNYSPVIASIPYPALFSKPGWKKVRFSFSQYCEPGLKEAYAYIQFMKGDSVITSADFYMNNDYIFPGRWDYKEFGYEIADTATINSSTVDHIQFKLWNVFPQQTMYIDDAKVEFVLTDRSFETVR